MPKTTSENPIRKSSQGIFLAASFVWGLWFVLVGKLALVRVFGRDEFTYSHAAWLVSQGQVPYRDFFITHMPLPYYLGAPVFAIFGSNPQNIIYLRLLMVVVYAILLAACGALVRSRLAILVAPALSVFASPFTVTMIQFRPDCLAITMFLLSALFLLRGYEFTAGLLGAAALLCSEKAGIYLLAIPIFLLPRGVFASAKYFLASALTIGSVVALALYSDTVKPFLDSTVSWAIAHEQHYPTQNTEIPLKQALRYDYLGLSLFILGSSMMLLREKLSVSLGFAAVFCLTLVSAVVQRAPYNYTLVPLLAVAFLMSLFFFKEVERKLPRSPRYATPLVVALMCMMLMSSKTYSGVERNYEQMALLHTVSQVSSPSDYFYDNRGMYVARPHATKWWFTDLMMRERYPLLEDIRRSFDEKDVMFFIREDRFEMLPAEIKAYVLARFLPYNSELYVWGRSWEGAVSEELNVPRSGEYIVKGSVAIDGMAVKSEMITLTRGLHRVVSDGAFSISWKPAVLRPGDAG